MKHSQSQTFEKMKKENLQLFLAYEREREKIAFFKQHQKDIKESLRKKWPSPCSRLEAARFFQTLNTSIDGMISYTFEPEETSSRIENQEASVTKIIVVWQTESDCQIYTCVQELLKGFPGVLIPRKLSLTQSRKDEKKFINATFLCDWIYLRRKDP